MVLSKWLAELSVVSVRVFWKHGISHGLCTWTPRSLKFDVTSSIVTLRS